MPAAQQDQHLADAELLVGRVQCEPLQCDARRRRRGPDQGASRLRPHPQRCGFAVVTLLMTMFRVSSQISPARHLIFDIGVK